MDRRRYDREPSNLELYARVGSQVHRRLQARDISTDGVFVEGWSSLPPQGAQVNITFVVGGGQFVKLVHRDARVARVTVQGVGLVHGGRARRLDRDTGRVAASPWSSLRWPEVD